MTPRWRVVAVLMAASALEAEGVRSSLPASMADVDARVYVSGPHLVVVTSVPAADGPTARRRLQRTLSRLLPPSTAVADVWHRARPLVAPAEAAATTTAA